MSAWSRVTALFAQATLMAWPIAAGVLGMARTMAAPLGQRLGETGERPPRKKWTA